MTLFPDAQSRAKQEIDTVIGSEHLISLNDRASLPYVEALLREVVRWRPVTPLSIFHACSSDDIYKGYYIPKGQQNLGWWRYAFTLSFIGATVVSNIWYILPTLLKNIVMVVNLISQGYCS